jgi:hypothetical protein
MAAKTKQVLKPLRKYPGERDANWLVHWLNSGKQGNRERILKLITALEHFSALIDEGKDFSPEGHQAIDEVNEILKVFKVQPILWSNEGHKMEFAMGLLPQAKIEPEESQAFDGLSNICELGLFRRLRKCKYNKCGKWLFAKFEHQICCPGGECYQKHKEGLPTNKEKRRDYQREYQREYYHKFLSPKSTSRGRKNR